MHFATGRLPDDGLPGPRQVSGPTPIVLALPWGGVPVAAEVARALDAPVDLILVRKIGVPYQPELAMGAVVDGSRPLVVRNADVTGRRRTTNFRGNRDLLCRFRAGL